MRSGYVAVIGKANAGKSTLLNVLVGEKVAIVSPKPQTTRDRILGVLTREDRQIVFADTPGLYRAHNALTDLMMRTTDDAAKDVDAILYVHDGHAGLREENIPPDIKRLSDEGVNADVYPVSARKGQNVRRLEDAICALLPEGERVFQEDIVSDRSEKFMISELMREKILLKYDKEIPHGVAIVVNTFEKKENGVYDINLDIVCEKRNHKAILIGKQGKALKEVASFARQDMEKFLGAKVFLTVYVKVKEDWRDREGLMREFGYHD